MANTYTQLYVHIIFATHLRSTLLNADQRQAMESYISGIIMNRGHKLICIKFMPDHAHMLINIRPTMAIADLVRDIKAVSSKHINEQLWIPNTFRWQEGYSAFSYAASQLDDVIRYINNQEEHHKRSTFREEYTAFLKRFGVAFEERYLYDFTE